MCLNLANMHLWNNADLESEVAAYQEDIDYLIKERYGEEMVREFEGKRDKIEAELKRRAESGEYGR